MSAAPVHSAGLLQVVRAGYGGALLTVPGLVIRLVTGCPAGPAPAPWPGCWAPATCCRPR